MAVKGLKMNIPTIFLAVYFIYALTAVGMTGLLFSVAVGLILYGLVDSYELLVAGIILSGIVWKVYLSKIFKVEGFVGGNPVEISQRIQAIQKGGYKRNEPSGVGNSFAEGFADANTEAESKKSDTPPATAESKPAPTTAPTVSPQLEKALPTVAPKEEKKESFNNPGPQPFKLALPEETKGGFHIDAGTTIMNALKNLKPEQIEAMTADTQNLINTQKSLMGMLQTMKPMLNDGQQLMETFQQMFGK